MGVVSQHLQYGYSSNAIGLYVVLSGFYSSDGIWQHQEFDEAKLDRAKEVMDLLSITHLKDREFSTMSTGEQRKFLLARSLVNDPAVLVFDEPTSGLHFHDIKQLLSVIFRLRDRNNTIVIIEHNLDVIKTADWIVDLGPEGGNKGGEIIAYGTPEEVVMNKKSFTGQFLKQHL